LDFQRDVRWYKYCFKNEIIKSASEGKKVKRLYSGIVEDLTDYKEELLEFFYEDVTKTDIIKFENATWFNYNQFYLDPACSDYYNTFFYLKANLMLLLARGYARDKI